MAAILRLDDDSDESYEITTTTTSSPVKSRPAIKADPAAQTFAGLLDDTATSSQEDDWTWLTNFGAQTNLSDDSNPKPNIKAKRKAHVMLSQTIVEESSSG